MPAGTGVFLRRIATGRWPWFFGKAAVLLGLLFLFAVSAPNLPPIVIALFWAALSVASAIGVEYHVVIRKTHRQFMLREGGRLSRFNSGRVFSLIVAFLGSAVCMAGLILEVPKWNVAEWLVLIAGVVLYPVIFFVISQFVAKEFEPPFRASRVTLWSSLVVGVFLCILEIIVIFVEPTAHYESAMEAFTSAAQPFGASSSALLAETGRLSALVDGLTSYGLSKAADVSFGGYLAWRIILSASGLFGIASLLGTCTLRLPQLRQVFLPLEAAKKPGTKYAPVRKYVLTAGVLPLALIACFIVADFGFGFVAQSEEYTDAENLIRDQVGIAVYVLDGKYYDQQAVEDLINEANEKAENLVTNAETTLVPLINEAYDQRIANVDDYLDWYYSLPADYGRLIQIFTGTVEEGMREQLAEKLNQGVDDTELTSQLEGYLEQANSLKSDLMDELSEHEITNVPEWLIGEKETLNPDFLSEPLAPTQKLLDAGGRLGLSAGVGAVAGIVGKNLVQKVLAKPFFNKIVTKLTQALGSRGLGQALGGGVGTVVAPGVGTALGIAAGTAIGVLSDYLFLKADEGLNREEYRKEIVDAIEEERANMLAIVRIGDKLASSEESGEAGDEGASSSTSDVGASEDAAADNE